MYRIILANTHTEAMEYARAKGFPRGSFRYATRAATIKGLRAAEIHELPSFALRMDKHAINAALRFARVERIQVTNWEYGQTHQNDVTTDIARVADQAETTALKLLSDTIALGADEDEVQKVAEDRLCEAGMEEHVASGEAEPSEDAAPAEKPKRAPSKGGSKPKPKPKNSGEPIENMDFF